MAAWLRGTKESLPSKHRRDRERKETAHREHCREATHLSFSCADWMSVPPDQTFPTDENRATRVSLDGALHDGRGTPTVNCFRQEHQVGRFLSIFEERLTRRAYLRTHGQPAR